MKLALILLLAFGAWADDLQTIRSEPNLERRSEKALAYANRAISDASEAYKAGKIDQVKALMSEAAESVELSFAALNGTGKNPRQSPKYFKRAELNVREMLRRLKGLETDFEVDDRPLVEAAETRIQRVHDELLNGIMTKKK